MEGDAAEGSCGVEPRPREVNVVKFAKERVKQIAELLDVIENTSLVSGEVTKGPRTAIQRLPRHMRRRAMSYNVKRLPRSKRFFAASASSQCKHRKKPPSRYFRRRPRNLLLNYVRRQRKFVWLETHIWHAKRFRMQDLWGYKLPLRSYQRAFRPTYRDAMRHCVVHDVSYLRCFQIVTESEAFLIDSLRPLCAPSTSATFAYRCALEGHFEAPILLYEPGRFPHGFIGPARFMWTHCGSSRCLLVWAHPAHGDTVLDWLRASLDLSKKNSEDASDGELATVPKSVDEWRLRNLRLRIDVYEASNGATRLIDWRDRMVRLRLRGPKSLSVLKQVLSTVDECECVEPWMKNFVENNQFWNCEAACRSPGELPDGCGLSVLVEDPRLTRPLRKTKPTVERGSASTRPLAISEIPKPRGEFWDCELHKKVLEKKLSEAKLQKLRSGSLLSPRTSKAKIPVVLVARSGRTGTASTAVGVDVIVPSGFGMEFWLALQYGTAHAAGLDNQKSLEFEADQLNFPADTPDCSAGRRLLLSEYETLKKKYLARPHNRRVRYWSGLSVKYPFSLEWKELVADWQNPKTPMSTDDGFYVLRDRRALAALDLWIRGKKSAPVDLIEEHSLALVAVRLTAVSTACPRRFALICALTAADMTALSAATKEGKPADIVEPIKSAPVKEIEPEIKPKGVKVSEDSLEEYIELSPERSETLLRLDTLFPDKDILRARKRSAVKKEKRLKARAAKRRKANNEEENTEERAERRAISEGQLFGVSPASSDSCVPPETLSYRNSCSREVLGRVMRGDFSFSCGKGRALGYCTLRALLALHGGIVLFRNASSSHYHAARLMVLRVNADL